MRKLRVIIQKQRNGNRTVRVEQPNGSWTTAGTFATLPEARVARDHARALIEEHELGPDDSTFRRYGEALLDRFDERGLASAKDQRGRWDNHVVDAPFIDADPRTIKRRDVKRFRDSLPARGLSPKTQREVMLLVRAVFAELLEDDVIRTSPVAGLKLPSAAPRKAYAYLYPSEEAALMRASSVPLCYRVLLGFLAREGMRKSEALALTWDDLDLERGVVRLDVNKTNDPRAWVLGSDVAATLRWWKKGAKGRWVFRGVRTQHLTSLRGYRFRAYLAEAGIDRPELFEESKARSPIRIHDLRATFVTLALAAGQTETWVTDRTGHRSHHMVRRYRRAARTVAELGHGWLEPLDALLGLDDPQRITTATDRGRGGRNRHGGGALKTRGRKAFEFESRRGYQGDIAAVSIAGVVLHPTGADHVADLSRRFLYAALDDPEQAQKLSVELAAIAKGLAAGLDELADEVLEGGPLMVRRTVRLLEVLDPPKVARRKAAGGDN